MNELSPDCYIRFVLFTFKIAHECTAFNFRSGIAFNLIVHSSAAKSYEFLLI